MRADHPRYPETTVMKKLGLSPFVCALPLFFAIGSCASTEHDQSAAPMEKPEKKKEDKDDPAIEIADKERELLMTAGECVFIWANKAGHPIGVITAYVLEVKRTSVAHSIASAEESVEDAQTEVEKALKALTVFREIDKPRRTREMEIRVARGEFSIENSKQDLEQMKADYEGVEEFYAKKTGEIVVWRTETSLQFAKDSHALTLQSQDKLMKHSLPDEEADLMRKLARKKAAHTRTVEKVGTARIEGEAGLIRAEAKVEKARRALEKAKKKGVEA